MHTFFVLLDLAPVLKCCMHFTGWVCSFPQTANTTGIWLCHCKCCYVSKIQRE